VILLVVCGVLYLIGGTATNSAIKHFKENMWWIYTTLTKDL
jgi:hypothetical protein